MLRFSFSRSTVIFKIIPSEDKLSYLVFSNKYKPLGVLISKLRLEVHPRIGKHTSAILFDIGSNVIFRSQFSGEAIIAAEEERQLKEFFERNNVPYPGLTKKK